MRRTVLNFSAGTKKNYAHLHESSCPRDLLLLLEINQIINDSYILGIITGAWDFGGLLANIAVTYIAARGHRTRWVASGMLLMGFSSFLRVTPYLMFGAGDNVKLYAKTDFENSTGNLKKNKNR